MRLVENVLCCVLATGLLHGTLTFTTKNNTLLRPKMLASVFFSENQIFPTNSSNRKNKCSFLRKFDAQRTQCSKRRGFSETLLQARALAVEACEEQFKWNQWNCKNRKRLFKKVYRETALMQSLSSAAVMYSIAKSCAKGSLQDCGCSLENRSMENDSWKWGKCGDNVMGAHQITKHFFQINKRAKKAEKVLRHDSEVGIKTVLDSQHIHSTCHGLSASCLMKIQWRRLRSFKEIAGKLKKNYHSASKLQGTKSVQKQISTLDQKIEKLLFISQSENFCRFVSGRRCRDPTNCDTLCCGGNYVTSTEKVPYKCNCRNYSNVEVVCLKVCHREVTVYRCL